MELNSETLTNQVDGESIKETAPRSVAAAASATTPAAARPRRGLLRTTRRLFVRDDGFRLFRVY